MTFDVKIHFLVHVLQLRLVLLWYMWLVQPSFTDLPDHHFPRWLPYTTFSVLLTCLQLFFSPLHCDITATSFSNQNFQLRQTLQQLYSGLGRHEPWHPKIKWFGTPALAMLCDKVLSPQPCLASCAPVPSESIHTPWLLHILLSHPELTRVGVKATQCSPVYTFIVFIRLV